MEKLIIVIVLLQHILDSVHLDWPVCKSLSVVSFGSVFHGTWERIVIPLHFVVCFIVTFTRFTLFGSFKIYLVLSVANIFYTYNSQCTISILWIWLMLKYTSKVWCNYSTRKWIAPLDSDILLPFYLSSRCTKNRKSTRM